MSSNAGSSTVVSGSGNYDELRHRAAGTNFGGRLRAPIFIAGSYSEQKLDLYVGV
jgi:hypothetical protein